MGQRYPGDSGDAASGWNAPQRGERAGVGTGGCGEGGLGPLGAVGIQSVSASWGGGAGQGTAAAMESNSQGVSGTPQPCGWGLRLPYLQDFWEETGVVSGALGAPW